MRVSNIAELREMTWVRYLSLVIRLILAWIFIVSSINKLPMQMEFVDIVRSFEILPDFLSVAYGAALPWVELLAACYLLLGILIKPSAVIVFLMCISFLVANISALITGNMYCPSCFGEIFNLTVPLAITVDILVMIASVVLLVISGNREPLGFDAWFRRRFGSDS